MRLLNTESLELEEFRDDSIPPYVAASHRWLSDEAIFQDVRDRRNTECGGYHKVKAFATYVRDSMPHIKWLWIDTCCINKDSAAELSEAINSMFEWYRNSELCIAYLADVETTVNRVSLEKSEWFKRGWTLQELLAPRKVLFVTNRWEPIGYKGDVTSGDCWATVGFDLEESMESGGRRQDMCLMYSINTGTYHDNACNEFCGPYSNLFTYPDDDSSLDSLGAICISKAVSRADLRARSYTVTSSTGLDFTITSVTKLNSYYNR